MANLRKLYIVAPGTQLTAAVLDAAEAAGASEILHGIPRRLQGQIEEIYPQTYTEPDDPERAPLRLAAAVLLNQLERPEGTPRTAAQVNNALDAITLILRRIAKNEMDR